MERTVILEFPDQQQRAAFIGAMKLADYTLHEYQPILYCKLEKPGIALAVKDFGAKDRSFDDGNNYLFSGFLDTLFMI